MLTCVNRIYERQYAVLVPGNTYSCKYLTQRSAEDSVNALFSNALFQATKNGFYLMGINWNAACDKLISIRLTIEKERALETQQENYVRVELIGNRGELILNRPEQKNSLIGPLVKQLLAGLTSLVSDDNCHAILIRGEGGAFCAGLDVKAFFSEVKPDWLRDFQHDWLAFHSAVYCCPKPIIGAMERFAIAGGSALAFCCDFLVVGKKSFIHVAEVELGMAAPINIAWLALKQNMTKAMELAVLGERHYGEDMMRLGLATSCVEDEDVLNRARDTADRLAGFKPEAVQNLKLALYAGNSFSPGVEAFEELVARIKNVTS